MKLYIELVYPIIDYCSVCSSGAASSKSHWLFDLHLQKSQLGEFPHIGLIANISSMHHAGPSSSTLYQIINFNWSDKQQPEALLAEWIKISLKCLDVSLCFARCEFDCGVTLTHANYWIISVDSSTNPSQSLFNQFEDAEPLFRHMVPHSPVHARSRANLIKHVFQRPKFCTEARDSVLKPAHTIGGCRSSPEARSQRSPWFSRPAIAASPESHILSDSDRFKELIIKLLVAVDPRVTRG